MRSFATPGPPNENTVAATDCANRNSRDEDELEEEDDDTGGSPLLMGAADTETEDE